MKCIGDLLDCYLFDKYPEYDESNSTYLESFDAFTNEHIGYKILVRMHHKDRYGSMRTVLEVSLEDLDAFKSQLRENKINEIL